MPALGKPYPLNVQTAPGIGTALTFSTSPFKSCIWGSAHPYTAEITRVRTTPKDETSELASCPFRTPPVPCRKKKNVLLGTPGRMHPLFQEPPEVSSCKYKRYVFPRMLRRDKGARLLAVAPYRAASGVHSRRGKMVSAGQASGGCLNAPLTPVISTFRPSTRSHPAHFNKASSLLSGGAARRHCWTRAHHASRTGLLKTWNVSPPCRNPLTVAVHRATATTRAAANPFGSS